MVHRDALTALGLGLADRARRSPWRTLVLSIGAGALLGLHRDVSPLTGALALVAGGASGLVAIARELGGDDRVVAVVQYLRVASDHRVDARRRRARLPRREDRTAPPRPSKAARRLGISASECIVVIVLVGATAGKLVRLPGAGLLGPMALTIALQLTGMSFGMSVPLVLVQLGYAVIGWQAGVAFTRRVASARSAVRCPPHSV